MSDLKKARTTKPTLITEATTETPSTSVTRQLAPRKRKAQRETSKSTAKRTKSWTYYEHEDDDGHNPFFDTDQDTVVAKIAPGVKEMETCPDIHDFGETASTEPGLTDKEKKELKLYTTNKMFNAWGGRWPKEHVRYELDTERLFLLLFQHGHSDALFRNLYKIHYNQPIVWLNDSLKLGYSIMRFTDIEGHQNYMALLRQYARKHPDEYSRIQLIARLKLSQKRSQSFAHIVRAARAMEAIVQGNFEQAHVDFTCHSIYLRFFTKTGERFQTSLDRPYRPY
jgi:hypothetical protein